jgi:hypothetical protein
MFYKQPPWPLVDPRNSLAGIEIHSINLLCQPPAAPTPFYPTILHVTIVDALFSDSLDVDSWLEFSP